MVICYVKKMTITLADEEWYFSFGPSKCKYWKLLETVSCEPKPEKYVDRYSSLERSGSLKDKNQGKPHI